MQLLIIRHAIAEDREVFAGTGQDDALRPLTDRGRRRMRLAARGLRTVVRRIDLLASSPLVRARQTADIVAQQYLKVERVEVEALIPETPPEQFLTWVVGQAERDVVAAVGHEPSLSAIVTWLLAGRQGSLIDLKKGAACLVDFPGPMAAGRGVLQWALTPTQLRSLGRG